jgi:hypothetical protein
MKEELSSGDHKKACAVRHRTISPSVADARTQDPATASHNDCKLNRLYNRILK